MESLAFNAAEKLLGRLGSLAFQEISLALSVKVEIDKLKETLETITLVLQDAERKQTKNPLITHWLRKLNDVCYEADDVLDDFEYQKLRMQVINRGDLKGKVRNIFSSRSSLLFRNKMGHRVKDIRERLDQIAVEKDKYSLVARDTAAGDSQGGVHGESRETHSCVQSEDVIGRDDDAKEVIGHLLKDNCSHGGESLAVISIVGIGGLGKTTIAKLVYHDQSVVHQFHDLRMWVCVSDNFDKKKLIRDIISCATGENCGTNETLEQIQNKLQTALRDKNYLLVLDDVWENESTGVTAAKWIDLKTLLNVGGNGSKIIVTTRSQSVASLMDSMHVHTLQGLPHEHCMSLFIKRAFKKGEEQHYPQLMEIAQGIVAKCRGVPLALATLGGLLYFKRDKTDWLNARDDDIWKLKQADGDILPALKLSYDALPSYLKPCFAYFSLFPKDSEFGSYLLSLLWMAEGFLPSSKGNQGFHEIGLDYIRQLCSRSLAEITEPDDPLDGGTLKMHDLVHDLAMSVAQQECSSMNFRPSVASERVRHVSISPEDLSEVKKHSLGFIFQFDNVLTILIPREYSTAITNQSFFKTCISRFKYLRVLDMSYLEELEALPNSIGNLSHLRYLDISGNDMIEKLPDSICKLHNLQTLMLLGCDRLKELPEDIGNLVGLVVLGVTTQQRYLPKGFKCLTSLQFLFVRGCDNLKSLGEEIQCLTNLRKLFIRACPNLELLPLGDLKCLTHLQALGIRYCKENPDIAESGEGIWSTIAQLTYMNQLIDIR